MELPLVPQALSAAGEVLPGEELVDEGAAVGESSSGAANAHGLEVGDGAGEEPAVEAEDEAAEGAGIGAGRGVVGDGAFGPEVARAEAQVEVDAVGHGGVRRRRRRRRSRRWGVGEGEGGGEEEEGAAREERLVVGGGSGSDMAAAAAVVVAGRSEGGREAIEGGHVCEAHA